MRAIRKFSLTLAATAILLLLAIALTSLGANSRFTQSSAPTPSAKAAVAQTMKTYTMYSGLWRTDGGFVSTIRIKNVLVVAPLDVTPVLFMADGTPYMLPSVHVPVSGVVTVNINDALAAAPQSVASHVSQFGSVSLIWSYSSPGHVTAETAAIDAARSLSFVFMFGEPMGEPMEQTLDGLWWKHDPGVSGFVALNNVTDADKQVTLQLVGSGNNSQPARTIALAAHSTQMLHLEDLASNPSTLSKQAGGIRIQYTGQLGSIQVVGGLENVANGYSANIPFWGHDMSSSSPTQITYAFAGLMFGRPNPMMMPGFPKETLFSPYLALRNTTEKPMDVSLQLNYMVGTDTGAPVSRNLAALHLAPLESRVMDMQTALNGSSGLKNFNGSINLSVSYSGIAGDLIMTSGSVDQTGTYVFEVEPQGIASSRSKYTNYWGVANGNDTMFSLWNPTNAAQDIIATFYYGDGSGKYNLPVHLEPQASTMIDMAMLIAENKPDSDGSVIPPNVREGSAQFSGAKDRRDWITMVIASGVYNVSNATCSVTWVNCCGVTVTPGSNPQVTPGSFSCAVGGTVTLSGFAVNCEGFSHTPDAWHSNNTSVATVDIFGNVSCASPGSASIFAEFHNMVLNTGQVCGPNPSCTLFSPQAGSAGTVTPRIDSVSPSRGLIGTTISHVTINGQGFTGGHVNTPSSIQVSNITTFTDTQIVFDAIISSTATPGNNAGAIYVTASSQDSNKKDFYVQVPTSLSMVGGTASGTTERICGTGVCGTIVSFRYQVNDQDSPTPQPIRASMSMWDSFASTFNPDNLHLQGTTFFTTCPNNTGPCNVFTNTDGTFTEGALGGCSTVCWNGSSCTTGGPSGIAQTWHIASSSIVQQISEYCEKVLVNGTQVQ